MATELYGGQPRSFEVVAAAVAPIVGQAPDKQSWLDRKHKLFTKMCPRWCQVSDFYLGEVADQAIAKNYLIRRYQGEPQKAFDERLECADFTPHLGTIIDTLAGMLFAVEDRVSRVWSNENKGGLGDPAEPGTPANRLWHNADGKRGGWPTLWRQFALDLVQYQYMWVLVDTVKGAPVVKLVPPTKVPNWLEDGSMVLMCEDAPTTASLKEADNGGEQYILWTLTGWERYKKSEEGTAVSLGSGTYKYQDRDGNPALPIFRVELPLRRYVAWLLARKAAVMFNQESVRDFALRIASFAKLILGVETDEQFAALLGMVVEGQNVLPEKLSNAGASGGHRFINPPKDPVESATAVLDKKREDFFASGFKMFEDAAREVTATEVKQQVAAGVGAFLQLLKAAVDDGENGAMYLLEQAEFSESSNKWGIAKVERSDDFSAVDLGAILDTMRNRYVGKDEVIPLGRSALIQFSKDSAKQDGLPADEFEIANAVDAALIGHHLSNLTMLGSLPAIAKARLTMKLVAALGLVDPQEEVEMSDGEKANLFKLLMKQAEDLATQNEEAQQAMNTMPPFGGGGFGGDKKPADKKEPPPKEKA